MAFPEIVRTSRLTLRRWQEEHVEAMTAVWADPEVWGALRPGEPFDPAFAASRAELHVRHWHEHGFGLWVVEERASGELAGWVGPWHPTFVPELADRVEIGWTLRRPFWGRGLATEGAEAAVAAAFSHLAVGRGDQPDLPGEPALDRGRASTGHARRPRAPPSGNRPAAARLRAGRRRPGGPPRRGRGGRRHGTSRRGRLGG